MLVGVFVGFFVGIFIVGFFVGFFVGNVGVGFLVGFFVGFFVGVLAWAINLPNTYGKKGVVRFDTGPLTTPSPHATFLPFSRLVQSASTDPSAQKVQLLQAVSMVPPLPPEITSPAIHCGAPGYSQKTYVSMPAATLLYL
jgi:hypothetical protein